MKLDYKILWLDDKMEVIEDDRYDADVARHLEDQGFNPILVKVKDEKAFFDQLDDSFDLILTDYHLNQTGSEARDGDKIIGEVRAKSILTEIMFYTAQGEIVDTIKLDRITFVDTKRVAGSDHIGKVVKKAIDLIDLTIRKFQHIVAMRGMIMNETSSLDLQMLNIIKLALKHKDVNFDELAPKIYDELNELYNSKNKFVDECRASGKFTNLTKDTFVFSAEYKIKTLGQILANLKVEDFSGEYKDEINLVRNKFAHAILLKDENGREYFKHGESGIDFNEDLCRKIRKDLTKFRNRFDSLVSQLTS